MDASDRCYRHGGDQLGADASIEWAEQALCRINPGGGLKMYTGSAIQAGRDSLKVRKQG